jgi:hypothetical protein
VSAAEGGAFPAAVRPTLDPGPLQFGLGRVTGPRPAPGTTLRKPDSDQVVSEQRVMGLLGGAVALLSVLIGARGSLVALDGAGMLNLPHLTALNQPGLAGFGLLLKTLLTLERLTFTVTHRAQLRLECPSALPEPREPPQVGELV